MNRSDLHDRGLAMRTELLGEAFVERMNASTHEDPVMQEFRELVASRVFREMREESADG